MDLAKELDEFFRHTNQNIFIEAEGKPDIIQKFIMNYNANYTPNISVRTDGIIQLQSDANKWGLELRLYFHDKYQIPDGLIVTRNNQYRNTYAYRINDKSTIEELFKLGYRIGYN